MGYGARAPCGGELRLFPALLASGAKRRQGLRPPRQPRGTCVDTKSVLKVERKSVLQQRPFTATGSEAARTTATRSIAATHKQHVPAIIVQVRVNSRLTRRDEAQLRHLPGFRLATLAAPGSNARPVDTSQRAPGANSDFFAPLCLPRQRALPRAARRSPRLVTTKIAGRTCRQVCAFLNRRRARSAAARRKAVSRAANSRAWNRRSPPPHDALLPQCSSRRRAGAGEHPCGGGGTWHGMCHLSTHTPSPPGQAMSSSDNIALPRARRRCCVILGWHFRFSTPNF